jgi:hypothetical protein
MKSSEFINEGWSQKYKSSINCSHPKGFSQQAHCAGKKKHNESVEMEMVCPNCGMCQTHSNLDEIKKGQKDSNGYTRCWPGKHAEGTKKSAVTGQQVRNCVPNESINKSRSSVKQGVAEGYSYTGQISDPAERSRIHDLKKLYATFGNSAEGVRRARYLDSVGLLKASKQEKELLYRMTDEQGIVKPRTEQDLAEVKQRLDPKCWTGKHKEGTKIKGGIRVNNCVPNESIDEAGSPAQQSAIAIGMKKAGKKPQNLDEQFDMIEDMVEQLAEAHGVDADLIWEDFESVDDHELLETAAWRRSAGKSKKGGLNAKGVASYRRENPGSKLQMAVTTKPSKLKAGSKAAKRRKSFCARMGGVKGPMKKPNGKPTRKALALRKWNC